ncbi:hypothetical protein BJF78_27965 [Pseudonocardia sp. CNS-139]|nr:hypothetical protein BJF78_27965 [Pseudonocardia sp. CNS-139]
MPLGPHAPLRFESDALLFALRRLTRSGRPEALASARSSAEHALAELRRLVVEPLGVDPEAPLVVVPTADTHRVVWSALHRGPVSVAPSASAWAATATREAGAGPVVVVAGPDLPGAEQEAEKVAACHPHVPTVLRPEAATTEAVLHAMAGAGLVHLACHGVLRADNPIFSALRMVDGLLPVHELDLRGIAPPRIVLAACDSAADVAYAGDEVLGFVGALLARGTAGLVASVVPVGDVESVELMERLHVGLAAGLAMADALHVARAGVDTADPRQFVNWCAFTAYGAGSNGSSRQPGDVRPEAGALTSRVAGATFQIMTSVLIESWKGSRMPVAMWRHLRDDHRLRRELLRDLQLRRAGRADLVQFDVVEDGDRTEVLVVRGELLVRSEHLRSAVVQRLIADQGLEAHPVSCLDGRVTRLVGGATTAPSDTLLRQAGRSPVSANYVSQMGRVVIKGGPVPVQTAAGPRFPGPSLAERRGPAVAVLDTGIDGRPRSDGWLVGLATPDNVDPLDAIPHDGELDPGAGHGTFVAGVVQQVAPAADVRVYKVMDSSGLGSELRVACAILRAAADGATVINLSLGTHTMNDTPPVAFEVALELLAERHPDVLVLAAAGNGGVSAPCWPGAFPEVVAVGGLTRELEATEWSNHGEWVTCSAVGEGVVSTYVAGRRPGGAGSVDEEFGTDAWASWTGTSFAAPQVAGAIAARCAAEPGMTPRPALASLLADGPPVPGFGQAVRILPGS